MTLLIVTRSTWGMRHREQLDGSAHSPGRESSLLNLQSHAQLLGKAAWAAGSSAESNPNTNPALPHGSPRAPALRDGGNTSPDGPGMGMSWGIPVGATAEGMAAQRNPHPNAPKPCRSQSGVSHRRCDWGWPHLKVKLFKNPGVVAEIGSTEHSCPSPGCRKGTNPSWREELLTALCKPAQA